MRKEEIPPFRFCKFEHQLRILILCSQMIMIIVLKYMRILALVANKFVVFDFTKQKQKMYKNKELRKQKNFYSKNMLFQGDEEKLF